MDMTEKNTIIVQDCDLEAPDGTKFEVFLTLEQLQECLNVDSTRKLAVELAMGGVSKHQMPYALAESLAKQRFESPLPSSSSAASHGPMPNIASPSTSSADDRKQNHKSKSDRPDQDYDSDDEEELGGKTVTWSNKATKFLISLMGENEERGEKKKKGASYLTTVQNELSDNHFHKFKLSQIESKMKKLKQQYYKVKTENQKSGAAPTSWQYYEEMDDIFGRRPEAAPVATLSSSGKRTKAAVDTDTTTDSEGSDQKDSSTTKKKKDLRQMMLERLTHQKDQDQRREAYLRDKLALKERIALEKEKAKQLRHEERMKNLAEVKEALLSKKSN